MEKRLLSSLLVAVIAAAGIGLSACGGSDENVGDQGNDIGEKDGEAPAPDGGGGNSDSGGSWDSGSATDGGGSGLGFGEPCTQEGNPGDCKAGLVCRRYDQRGLRCTRPCTGPTECPETNKCGGNNYCKVP